MYYYAQQPISRPNQFRPMQNSALAAETFQKSTVPTHNLNYGSPQAEQPDEISW